MVQEKPDSELNIHRWSVPGRSNDTPSTMLREWTTNENWQGNGRASLLWIVYERINNCKLSWQQGISSGQNGLCLKLMFWLVAYVWLFTKYSTVHLAGSRLWFAVCWYSRATSSEIFDVSLRRLISDILITDACKRTGPKPIDSKIG